MKKSSFHKLIKTVITEMKTEIAASNQPPVTAQPATGQPAQQAGVPKQSPGRQKLTQLGQQFQRLDTEAKKYGLWTKERVEVEDEKMKLWWQMRKLMGLPNTNGKQNEEHGLGYSHNVSSPEDNNTMNKPTIGNT